MQKKQRVAIVGCGHVGTVTAACLAELGHDVIGVDVDSDLIRRLKAYEVHFIEPRLNELVVKNSEQGNLRLTTSYTEALDGVELVVLCVNTPATSTRAADLR